MKDLEKRIGKLEAAVEARTCRVLLRMRDGSSREISGPRDLLLRLHYALCTGRKLTPKETEQVNLISRAIGAKEPGRGHMVEIIWAGLSAGLKEYGRKLEAALEAGADTDAIKPFAPCYPGRFHSFSFPKNEPVL